MIAKFLFATHVKSDVTEMNVEISQKNTVEIWQNHE